MSQAVHPLVIAYVALGSNLGQRRTNIQQAILRLNESADVRVMTCSRLIETRAVGGPDGSPDYLNAAAKIETSLSPRALLQCLLNIEHAMGRRRRVRWEARVIDLDLLLYANRISDEQDMVIPHPRMHDRRFVLEPLAEIAGDVVHPTLGVAIADLFKRLG